MSLNMLIEFRDAFDFTGADFVGWCLEAGFSRIEVLPLAGPASAAIAYKIRRAFLPIAANTWTVHDPSWSRGRIGQRSSRSGPWSRACPARACWNRKAAATSCSSRTRSAFAGDVGAFLKGRRP
jgi:hypothetical protein